MLKIKISHDGSDDEAAVREVLSAIEQVAKVSRIRCRKEGEFDRIYLNVRDVKRPKSNNGG